MTKIYPISVTKAYKILQKLPPYIRREDALAMLMNEGMSLLTAKLYMRALKSWGFIIGNDELKCKKVSLEEFLDVIRKEILDEIDPVIIETITETYNAPFSNSIKLIRYFLDKKGAKISLWKLRNIVRILRSLNVIIYEKKIRPTKLGVDVKSMIKSYLFSRGALSVGELVRQFSETLGIDMCAIKRVVIEMLREGEIVMECAQLADLWAKAIRDGYCHEAEYDVEELKEFKEVLEKYPILFEREAGKIRIKYIADGEFLIYPLRTD